MNTRQRSNDRAKNRPADRSGLGRLALPALVASVVAVHTAEATLTYTSSRSGYFDTNAGLQATAQSQPDHGTFAAAAIMKPLLSNVVDATYKHAAHSDGQLFATAAGPNGFSMDFKGNTSVSLKNVAGAPANSATAVTISLTAVMVQSNVDTALSIRSHHEATRYTAPGFSNKSSLNIFTQTDYNYHSTIDTGWDVDDVIFAPAAKNVQFSMYAGSFSTTSVLGTSDSGTTHTILEVKTVLPGDVTRNGVVDFDDLIPLAQHYGTTGSQRWQQGDLNFDGNVNFDDLVILAQHYNSTAAIAAIEGADSGFAADWAVAQSLVPEPATLATLSIAAVFVRRRL